MAIYSIKDNKSQKINNRCKAYELLKNIFNDHSSLIEPANGYNSKVKSNDVVWQDEKQGIKLKFNHALNSIDVYLKDQLVNSFFEV